MSTENRYELNKNLAQMLKGGVIMDVTTPEQAKIAEAAGAAAVMALERIPADIRNLGRNQASLYNSMDIAIQKRCQTCEKAELQHGRIVFRHFQARQRRTSRRTLPRPRS